MEPAIQAYGLSKVYRGSRRPALTSVSLTVPRGSIFTLLGRNGAGKTTFLRIAATQLRPTAGQIAVLGFDALHQAGDVRRRIAVTPQEGRPFWALTPRDHVRMLLLMRGFSRAEARERTEGALAALDLGEVADTGVELLSGGLRQRVLVAMALATEAELLFLDEPTIGLDPVSRRRVWDNLRELRDQGRSVLLTTHYMDEAEALSDGVALIEEGRVLATGTVPEIKARVPARVRVDIGNGFEMEELASYGRVVRAGAVWRVLTNEDRAAELSRVAIGRRVQVNVGPVSLDDVFIELVGRSIEEGASA